MNRHAVQSMMGTGGLFALLAVAYYSIHSALYVACASGAGVALFLICLRRVHREEMAMRSLFCVMALPMLAWSLPAVRLLHLAMCFWVPVMAGRRERIAPLYLFSMLLLPPLDAPVEIGGLKLFDFGVQDGLAIGAAVAIWLKFRKSESAPRRLTSDGWVAAFLLMLGLALSRETTATNFLRTTVNLVLDLGLPYYILSRGVTSTEGQRMALRWLACGGVALTAVLVLEIWRSWPIYNELYGQYNVPMMLLVKARGGLMRAGGPFVEPTSIALVLAMCFAALSLLREDFRSALRHSGLLAITFLGVSAPQSRGAWIGLALASVAMAIYRGRWRSLLACAGGIGLALGIVFVTAQLSPTFAEALGLSDGGANETTTYRRDLFEKGKEVFWQSPMFGHSMPRLNVLLADLRQGEGIIDFVNTYLWIALIAGSAGLAIFIGNFLDPLVSLWKRRRVLRRTPGEAPAAFVFGVLVMLSEMLFFTSFGGRPAFLTLGLFGLSATILARPQARRAPLQWMPDGAPLRA
nr:O-antigen ligase family protein [uncultured Novosphingobium sp.]